MSGLQNNCEPLCRRSTNAHLQITPFFLLSKTTRRTIMKTQDATTMIRTYLKTLKLNRMASALDEELSRAVKEAAPPSELLERLLALEVGSLTERRIANCSLILILSFRKASIKDSSWNWPHSILPDASRE
jgi:hypothetical protein